MCGGGTTERVLVVDACGCILSRQISIIQLPAPKCLQIVKHFWIGGEGRGSGGGTGRESVNISCS